MALLKWCKKKKKGLKLIEPNENLAKEYIETAEETLEILKAIEGKSNIWIATTKYYCEYFAVYSILMKLGIKSEIHDCTIEVAKLLEKEKIFLNVSSVLENDKHLRIENQYYLKNIKINLNYGDLVNFVLYLKNIILTMEQIKKIRDIISKT